MSLFEVTRNILRDLEQDPSQTAARDLTNQALLSLLTLIEHEHDRRKQAKAAERAGRSEDTD